MPDYKQLLIKYIAHIIDQEGMDYLDRLEYSEFDVSAEDIATLRSISEQAAQEPKYKKLKVDESAAVDVEEWIAEYSTDGKTWQPFKNDVTVKSESNVTLPTDPKDFIQP